MRYLWVFLAYMGLKKAVGKFDTEYKFIKNPKIGFLVGSLVLWVHCICMYNGDVPNRCAYI